MKGRAVLFSAAIAVLTRPLVAEGANADADPARRATKAAVFIIFYIWYKVGGANKELISFVLLVAGDDTGTSQPADLTEGPT